MRWGRWRPTCKPRWITIPDGWSGNAMTDQTDEGLLISEKDAKQILHMDLVLWFEGCGPDIKALKARIYAKWPALIPPGEVVEPHDAAIPG